MSAPRLAIACLLVGIVVAAILLFGEGANSHDIYGDWHPPNNPKTSCCSNSDCRPTRAYVDQEGRWRAWNGTLWLIVPGDRVLPTDLAGDGRSHLCEKAEFIYCFSPGEPKS